MELDIRPSALKHGVSGESIAHAVALPLLVDDEFGGEQTPKVLVLGLDAAGNVLEVIGSFRTEDLFTISRNARTSGLPTEAGTEGAMMEEPMKFRIATEDVTMPDGQVLTEADFERMADEAEHDTPDYDAIFARARAKGGRPSLGDGGRSGVLQVRLDDDTRQRLARRAEQDHTTPSSIARDAIRAWLNAS